MDTKQQIMEGKTALGIELGSTRIKAVLINENYEPIASGDHGWENRLEDGIWTYSLDDVWSGLQSCFRSLAADVQSRYGLTLTTVGSIGISAMMHGYLVFDKDDKQLVPFRTWRNTITEKAAAELSEKFQFTIPQRWSIAHLYQAILNDEPHVKDIQFLTTLAGYVHWKLTNHKVIGLDDASGILPIDSTINNYHPEMIKKFDDAVSEKRFLWNLTGILPEVLAAGKNAGILTEEGAKLLDPSGSLKSGIPLCPPEGDAGTGMIATNSVAERTGNLSAGTSIFAMIVMEKALSKMYPEIDMIVTPAGKPVAMVHCNNCMSDIDAWVKLFLELGEAAGAKIDISELYGLLYSKALEADKDCGKLLAYNYYAGEHLTGIEQGRPLFIRQPDSNFNLANFMRTLIFSAMGTLKIGLDILTVKEKIKLDSLLGHGGFFKVKGSGRRLVAGALNTPVSVMESAGEGGAWGIALLAVFMQQGGEDSLEKFLSEKVFAGKTGAKIEPDPLDVESFRIFMDYYTNGLEIERAAVTYF